MTSEADVAEPVLPRVELEALRLGALQKCAAAEGVDVDGLQMQLPGICSKISLSSMFITISDC